ncbi:ferric reductase-like transmembrane domain-containing protein [Vibrio sp. 10N.286.48.C11]|uniref:ferredoxin reductase family protein n=1 Tax=Vibrio sp. 10N.286.48.C11 TaxID=3229698 RepID=UPI00354CC534
MKSIHYAFLTIMLVICGLWLTTAGAQATLAEFWSIRKSLLFETGIIATAAMSITVLLAVRHLFPDSFLDGLDKRYRLHKWLGIVAFSAAVAHWLIKTAPKWMIDLGLLTKPVKNKVLSDAPVSWFYEFTDFQQHFAKDIGEWAFYLFVALSLLILIKKIPYKQARQSHKLMAVVYLAIAYHSFILMKIEDWSTPVGVLMAVLLLLGTLGALTSLFGQIGYSKKTYGEISELRRYKDNKVLAVTIRPTTPWAGHQPGQFAFVTFDKKEGAHPFSIASDWAEQKGISFKIKQIGDYVNTLPATLSVGQEVVIEGPYGNFNFSSDKAQQIWVAGGIGIAPFFSKLEQLAGQRKPQNIDLFYATAMPDADFINKLQALADNARIRLHITNTKQQGYLTAQAIETFISDLHSTDFWVCGPAKLGDALKSHFVGNGLHHSDFHQELFEMR